MPSLPRRTVAVLAAVLALGATACAGGDRQPIDPAEEVGPEPGATPDPPPGQNVPLPDPGDNLEEPQPDEPADFEAEDDQ